MGLVHMTANLNVYFKQYYLQFKRSLIKTSTNDGYLQYRLDKIFSKTCFFSDFPISVWLSVHPWSRLT